MLVLRDPGELFVLRHTLRPSRPEASTMSWMERVHPESLATVARSPELPGGPFWPGGIAAHRNGSLHLVYGTFAHRLGPDCRLLASRKLPRPRPYNSFVILDDGPLVTKDLDRECRHQTTLTVLDPETLEPVCADVEAPEPSIARLSADGNAVYLVGDHTIFRYHWNPAGRRLAQDEGWQHRYRTHPDQSYGWDAVIEGGHAWFLDNGHHDYQLSMLGAGVAPGPIRLHRVSLTDSADAASIEVSGFPHGTCTNPPLYDPERRIALAYDSGNGVVAAWRLDVSGELRPLWQKTLCHAAHMIRYPGTGEVVVGDFKDRLTPRSPRLRAATRRLSGLLLHERVRPLLSHVSREDVVVLDLETGAERARVSVPSLFQSVLFPAPGWKRDFYYCSFSTIARLEVA
jgi:hypothetical protein